MFVLYIPQTETNISLPEFKKLMLSLDIHPSVPQDKVRKRRKREVEADASLRADVTSNNASQLAVQHCCPTILKENVACFTWP